MYDNIHKNSLNINITLNIILFLSLLTIIISNLFKPGFLSENIFKIFFIVAFIPVVIESIKGLLKKEVSTDLLAATALIFSFIAHEWHSAAFINLMLSSARIFDIWTQKRSEGLLESLLKYRSKTVPVQKNNNIIIVPLDKVKIGDLIIVKAGARIPLDGIVVSGQAGVDESTLTGEAETITKKPGDAVFSPTLNTSGQIIIKVTKTENESTLAKIIQLVENASIKKSKIVMTANKFAKWYILSSLLVALIAYLFTGNLLFVLSILLVVCADDIAVSIPLAYSIAIVRGSEKGILIKSAEVLEKISNIDTFITDKTGTLTSGKLRIVEIITFDGFSKTKFLKFLGAVEVKSNHPIAGPIVNYVKANNIKIIPSSKVNESPGEGMEAEVLKNKIIAGKVEFLKSKNVHITKTDQNKIDDVVGTGLSITALAVDKKLAGIIIFEDSIRPFAKQIVEKTKSYGVKRWIMITGDSLSAAEKVSKQTGIDNIKTNLTPSQKLKFIETEKKILGTKNLAMIGDGVNDAAALAMADVSIAMGAVGSDAAINAADVSLMNDNLEKIPEAIELGIETKNTINKIFTFWAMTNFVGLVLVFTKLLNPTGAATYNFITDFLPIITAFRIGAKKII